MARKKMRHRYNYYCLVLAIHFSTRLCRLRSALLTTWLPGWMESGCSELHVVDAECSPTAVPRRRRHWLITIMVRAPPIWHRATLNYYLHQFARFHLRAHLVRANSKWGQFSPVQSSPVQSSSAHFLQLQFAALTNRASSNGLAMQMIAKNAAIANAYAATHTHRRCCQDSIVCICCCWSKERQQWMQLNGKRAHMILLLRHRANPFMPSDHQ